MQSDALSKAFEVAEPSVPAATAIPDVIMPSSRAYSVADAPPSSCQKRDKRPAVLHIEYLPHNERSGCTPLQATYHTPVQDHAEERRPLDSMAARSAIGRESHRDGE